MISDDFDDHLNGSCMTSSSYPCYGVTSIQLNSDLLVQSQENYRDLLQDNINYSRYCPVLLSLKNQSKSVIRIHGLMGFFYPRKNKELDASNEHMRKPSSFYYSMNRGKNEFAVQSYNCAKKNNVSNDKYKPCLDCKNNWRTFRDKTALKYLKESVRRKY